MIIIIKNNSYSQMGIINFLKKLLKKQNYENNVFDDKHNLMIHNISESNIGDLMTDKICKDDTWKYVSEDEYRKQLSSLTNATKLLRVECFNRPIDHLCFVIHDQNDPKIWPYTISVNMESKNEKTIIDSNLPKSKIYKIALRDVNEKVSKSLCENIINNMFLYGWANHCLLDKNLNFTDKSDVLDTPEFDMVKDPHKLTNKHEIHNKSLPTTCVKQTNNQIDYVFKQVLTAFDSIPEYVIVNKLVATSMQKSPLYKHVNSVDTPKFNNDVYCIGTYNNIPVWVNPMMDDDDTRILLQSQRKFSDENGLALCSYIMREYSKENDGSDEMLVCNSKYFISPYGFNPEKPYFAFWIDKNLIENNHDNYDDKKQN